MKLCLKGLKVNDDVQCNCTIPGIDENVLTEKGVLNEKIKDGFFPVVYKTGFSTGPTEGKVDTYSFCFCHKVNGKRVPVVKKAYLVKVEEGATKPFMDEGDSGSAVLWKDKDGKKRVFAYCRAEVCIPDSPYHERDYVCFNLKDSLNECDPDLIPCFT